MNELGSWASAINADHKRMFHYEFVGAEYQIREIVADVAPQPFEPWPDPAALVVAARLLHDLVTLRHHIPFTAGPAWLLVETYLLFHDLAIDADDEDSYELLLSLLKGRTNTVSTLRFLRDAAIPVERLE